MDTMSYSLFRSHLASTLDKVNDGHKPVLITRQNGKPAIVMSLDDFKAYEETATINTDPIADCRVRRAHRKKQAD